MEMTKLNVDVTNPDFWLNAEVGTRIGLTDLDSLKEETFVAKALDANGQPVYFDVKDGVSPFRVDKIWDLAELSGNFYDKLFVVQLKSDNPNSADVFLILRRANQEKLIIEIYRDKSKEIFPNGIGDRQDLAEVSTGFFAGLENNKVALTGYAYANFIQNFGILDDKGEALNYFKIVELQGVLKPEKLFTLALYQTNQDVDAPRLLTIFELGGYSERGGNITWLLGNPATDVDVLALV